MPGTYVPKPLRPARTTARARVSALKRHHPEGGAAVDAAVRDLRVMTLEEHVREVVDQAPGLKPEQAERLAALLRGGDQHAR
jgi:DNA-binding response OmpR family regulator